MKMCFCGFPGNHSHALQPNKDIHGRVFESDEHRRWVEVLTKSDELKGGEVSHPRMVRGYDGIKRPGWTVFFPGARFGHKTKHRSIDATGYDHGGGVI